MIEINIMVNPKKQLMHTSVEGETTLSEMSGFITIATTNICNNLVDKYVSAEKKEQIFRKMMHDIAEGLRVLSERENCVFDYIDKEKELSREQMMEIMKD